MTILTDTNKREIRERGFTLIELIVVIAIIGLLVSVVLAALGKSRERADITKFVADYRAVSNALELYRQSNGGYPGSPNVATSISTIVTGSLGSYLKQIPSISLSVVSSQLPPDVYYFLNPSDPSLRLWCGDVNSTQDYVIYFTPTQGAIDSGFFPQLVDGSGHSTGFYCLSLNQK